MTPAFPIVAGISLKMVRGGSTIVDVPRIEIREGEVLSLIGPNGAGKTSLLQTLAFLVTPFVGDVLFSGRRVGVDCPDPGVSPLHRHGLIGTPPLRREGLGKRRIGIAYQGSSKIGHIGDRGGIPRPLRHFPPAGPVRPEPVGRRGSANEPRPRLRHEAARHFSRRAFCLARSGQQGSSHRRRTTGRDADKNDRHPRHSRSDGSSQNVRPRRGNGSRENTPNRHSRGSDEQTRGRVGCLPPRRRYSPDRPCHGEQGGHLPRRDCRQKDRVGRLPREGGIGGALHPAGKRDPFNRSRTGRAKSSSHAREMSFPA